MLKTNAMKIFLDSADTKVLHDGYLTGLIDGITTNPTLIRKSGRDPEAVYQELKGSHPNLIHLLGYEMGQATSQLLETHGEIPSKLSEALQKLTIATPRGNLSYNAYGESQVEEFKIRKFNFNEVRYHNEVIGTVEADFSSGLYKQFEPLEYTGWQNPYICT